MTRYVSFGLFITLTMNVRIVLSLQNFLNAYEPDIVSASSAGNILRHERSGSIRQDIKNHGPTHAVKHSGAFDLNVLRRGTVYAVNLDANDARKFQLLRVDVASDSPELAGPSGLSAHLRLTYPDANVGWAWYADTYSEDGWYRLEIRIDEDAPFADIVKARAAGFVEGNLQGQHMYRYWTNYRYNQYRGRGEAPSPELYNFLDEQYHWMTNKVEAATGWSRAVLRGTANPPEYSIGGNAVQRDMSVRARLERGFRGGSGSGSGSADGSSEGSDGSGGASDWRYWAYVGLVTAQFEGLAAGFWASVVDPVRNMTWNELYALNALGDMYELNVLFPPTAPSPPPPAAEPSAGPEPSGEPNPALEADAAAAAAAGGWESRRVRQRHYTPGHGEVGEYGYGELLDCSAIIKIDTANRDSKATNRDIEADGAEKVEELSTATSWREAAAAAAAAAGTAAARRASRRSLKTSDSASEVLGRRGRRLGEGRAGVSSRRSDRVRNFWAAHNTWRAYFEMVRTWKVYDLPWATSGPVTVSSSPGLLHSKDDWYTTDRFVVMETTNGIYNKSLYDLIHPRCVLIWQRAQVANFAARRGDDWVDLFGRHNSGTYNNQWMVLDVLLLDGGSRRDVLWVAEQMPGIWVSKDATKVLLDQGYWASYNVPYFPEIYNLTGYPQPSIYHTCPRARIFSREQSKISSRNDLMTLMRLNRYTDDPISGGLPNAAIAARYDLPATADPAGRPQNWTRRAYGAVDAKIVDLEAFYSRRTYVINGPTNDDQPSFCWSSDPLFEDIHHEGSVDQYEFGWQAYETVMGPPLRRPA